VVTVARIDRLARSTFEQPDLVMITKSVGQLGAISDHFPQVALDTAIGPKGGLDWQRAIGIGGSLAAPPSHTTVRTDRVYGGSADIMHGG
jgi:hypothetical protein